MKSGSAKEIELQKKYEDCIWVALWQPQEQQSYPLIRHVDDQHEFELPWPHEEGDEWEEAAIEKLEYYGQYFRHGLD